MATRRRLNAPPTATTNPSLNIKGTESRTLVYCHALCPTEDVLAALGLTMRDLYNEPFEHPKFGTVYAKYPYSDNRVVLRKSDKSFPQSGNTKGKNRALFTPTASAAPSLFSLSRAKRTYSRLKPWAAPRSVQRWARGKLSGRTGGRCAAST